MSIGGTIIITLMQDILSIIDFFYKKKLFKIIQYDNKIHIFLF